MKRIAVWFALLLLVCANALAQQELYPMHELDMETYGTKDCTVPAAFDPADIEAENHVLVYDIYDYDVYTAQDVKALSRGDTILVNGEMLTVDTVEAVNGGYDINGGFFCDEGEGASLVYQDGNTDLLNSAMYDDMRALTLVGSAAYELADEVTVVTPKWTEDLDYEGQDESVTLPAAQVKDYLIEISDFDKSETAVDFAPSCTEVTLQDGKVSVIRVRWTP